MLTCALSFDLDIDLDLDDVIHVKAPEAVTVLKLSSLSDVFSFGVLCFEVFTFGGFPFAAVADDSRYLELLTGTIRGKKVETELEALHRPLMLQIANVLAKHGVPSGAPRR